MKAKKSIAIIITLLLIVLPMISVPVQAATVGKVYNLTSEMKGNTVYFNWNHVSNADGYDVYINTANKGYEYIGSVIDNVAAVIGFKESNDYKAKVCAYQINSNGRKETGSFSDIINVSTTTTATLNKVNSLTASQNGGNVTLNWSKISNATGYQVFVDIPNLGYVNIGSVDGATSAIITGFENSKTYYFKVRAYKTLNSGALEYGAFSPEQKLTINTNKYEEEITKPEETKPARVNNLYIDRVDENQASISWSKASNADGYEIYVSKSNGSYKYIDTVYKTSAKLTNLSYDTNYKVKVVAFRNGNNGTVYGEESPVKSFTTPRDTRYDVGTVKNLYADVNENKVSLDWSRVSNIDGYEIWVKKGNGSYQMYSDSINNNYASIYPLSENTTYRIKVRAYTKINRTKYYGEYSNEVKFTTDYTYGREIGTVKNLYADVNGNRVSLDWSKVSNADAYEVWVKKGNGSYQLYSDTVNSNYASIYPLSENTTYRIKVRAYEKINRTKYYGEYSNEIKFTTGYDENSKISNVKNAYADVVNNRAIVGWSKVSGAKGYNVYLARKNSNSYEYKGTTTSTSMTLDHLSYSTTYKVKICAYQKVNGREKETTGTIVTFTTKSATDSKKEQNTWESSTSVPKVSGVKANVVKDTVYLTWNKVQDAVKYEIEFTVPGIGGSNKFTVYTNSREISGLTNKQYNYTAKIRAYKYVNGRLVAGQYSNIVEFRAK